MRVHFLVCTWLSSHPVLTRQRVEKQALWTLRRALIPFKGSNFTTSISPLPSPDTLTLGWERVSIYESGGGAHKHSVLNRSPQLVRKTLWTLMVTIHEIGATAAIYQVHWEWGTGRR